MKTIYLFAGLIFIGASASAQVTVVKPANSFIKLQGPKARLIGTSPSGSVYALPQDNMRCLVPSPVSDALIPTLRTPLSMQGIPNAFPGRDLMAINLPVKNNFKFFAAPKANAGNPVFALPKEK